VAPAHLGEEAYAATLAREFNQVQAENATKFGPIHPARDSYNFAPADSLAAFAREHRMAMRGHTLVWHRQNPRWLTQGDFKPAELSAILQEHIKSVVGHFAGQVYAWDVVNEAFSDDGTLRHTSRSDAPGIGFAGTAYIERALRWAHDADPKALLFYNDYSAESLNAKSDAIYKMVQDFKSRGVPLDGVGLQMHLTAKPPAFSSMEANIKRLTDLGLQVQITELDVRLPVDASGAAATADLASEARIYHDVTALCLRSARCTALQTWGFTDKYSWIPGEYHGLGAALEFDLNYVAKPAYDALREAFGSNAK
jgi:endo-1,4-beta-xylanase